MTTLLNDRIEKLNSSTRKEALLYCLRHGGTAYAGKLSLPDDCTSPVWETYGGDELQNFSADFLIPHKDELLEKLLWERHFAEYVNPLVDAERLHPIMSRIESLGGIFLIWG